MVLELNEYVRTKDGIIAKVIGVQSGGIEKYYFDKKIIDNFKELTQIGTENVVLKHSFNIIDLIEEGDYVNGLEVVTIYGYDEDGNDKEELGILETYVDEVDGIYLTDVNIKSIVTKEQFESMSYKVGE